MSRLYFRNTKNLRNISAFFFSEDNIIRSALPLTETDSDGDFVLEFDPEKFTHLHFVGFDSKGKECKTENIFPGELSLGIDYKWNESQKRDLTYLFSKQEKITGHIDTYILKDEKNLSYREDAGKKINIFVPAHYSEHVPHEILYFFDAQNLFSAAGSYTQDADPYGGWQLDIALNAAYHRYGRNIIVVAIDNSDPYRMSELFMNPKSFGKLSSLATDIADESEIEGHLDELYDFIFETVHPFVKEKYSVTDQNMGIGGSSMGGIAAFYCALRAPGKFAYTLSYSPAYGLYELEAFEQFFKKLNFAENADKLPLIHIYCGEGDELEKQLTPASKAMKKLLSDYGYPKNLIAETYDGEKVHNEEAWRLILGESFSFCLSK